MIPDFLQSQDPSSHIGLWKIIIGLFIVFLGTFVGVEIRIGKDEDDT
tara:strand:- start:62 stop:202 length:141 start_codon:yes stop_codon:yes gene_type:complete